MSGRPIDFSSHRREAQREDAQFLLDRGVSPAEVERRVGARLDTLDKQVERLTKRQETAR